MDILKLKEQTEAKKRIENLLEKTKVELQTEKEKLNKLSLQLEKEYADVQRIKEGGLTAMFYEILGSKEKKLDKERQEYLAAKLKYESCNKQTQELELEIKNLQKELLSCGSPELEYKRILADRKFELKEANDETFLKFENQLELLFSQKREVKEAIDAGKMALKGLSLAIKALGNAQGWGTVDMIGGGLLTTAIKHSKMDDARELIHDVQYWLRKFNRELRDVKVNQLGNMQLELDGLTTFADFFFDNLITDWIVQSKINRSLEGCKTVYHRVKNILIQLSSSDQLLTNKYKSTSKEFTHYIENI